MLKTERGKDRGRDRLERQKWRKRGGDRGRQGKKERQMEGKRKRAGSGRRKQQNRPGEIDSGERGDKAEGWRKRMS